MKKLLVLSLVLGIASLATAGYSFTDAKNVTWTIDVTTGVVTGVGTVDSNFTGGYLNALGTGTLLSVEVFDAAGDAGDVAIVGGSYVNYASEEFFNDVLPNREINVPWFAINYVFEPGKTIVISDLSGNELASGTMVPEPATMALLGLGALVLRRKK